ncbi:[protein-PII] uridylyltransferase [Chitinibacter sp. ZOR0017]|uniref:[protein-PII] uridylyltransferase n=1 Tax=Chitinibacter sp. ZOR0017 TaxID=1339254 RepID=UPI000AF42AC2|nr:[protein-PII] uridylyltransferase [Chitinibacter sp. ZOR0017]
MRSVTAIRQSYASSKTELQARFTEPAKTAPLLSELASLTDQTLSELWNRHEFACEVLLAAVGGYGRGELYPYSDIDLLILLPDQPSPALLEKLEIFVGELWDIGLEVGHSVRTLADCLNEAEKDITVQTALLEARLLVGDTARFSQFLDTVHRHIDPKEFFDAKLIEQQARYGRFQNATYKLEPNIKEAPGGLRDLHLIGWIAASQRLGRDWHALAAMGMLTDEENRKLCEAERVLRTYRIALHWRAKRREDRILFDYQHPLAKAFGLDDLASAGRITQRASEAFMAEYYLAARIVTQLVPVLLHALRARIFSQIGTKPLPICADFQIRDGLLETIDPDLFTCKPSSMLALFLHFEQRREASDIAPATLRALWHARHLIDDDFLAEAHNRQLFIALFREPRGLTRILRRMNQYGVLGRYIPEFGDIVGRMQHDLFHVYTVDEHTLMVLRNVRRFAVTAFTHEYPLCSRLLAEFERPEVIYLAALFHDIGKGRGGDHSLLGAEITRQWVARHPLPEADRELIVWLVTHHLTMSSVAQKQDVYDPEVIAEFAALVKDQRHLNALYLLTVADIRGTSPKVWNAWKAKLLEDLFKGTARYLNSQNITAHSWLAERQDEALRLLRLYGFRSDAHQPFWKLLDTVYFLRQDARDIAWHTRVLLNRMHATEPTVKAKLSESGEGLQVVVYTLDQPDLFAQICSFFEHAGYSIFDAHIHTTTHGYALDTFYVFIPDSRHASYRDLINYVEFELAQRIAKKLPLPAAPSARLSRQQKHFPVKPHVQIRADEKGKFHILSVAAGDRPGLLSTIARILAAKRIEIQSAKIMTLGERAEDHFLITGSVLNDERALLQLENDLLQALSPN